MNETAFQDQLQAAQADMDQAVHEMAKENNLNKAERTLTPQAHNYLETILRTCYLDCSHMQNPKAPIPAIAFLGPRPSIKCVHCTTAQDRDRIHQCDYCNTTLTAPQNARLRIFKISCVTIIGYACSTCATKQEALMGPMPTNKLGHP